MYVQRSGARVTRICGHFLYPGLNHVPDELEDRFLKDREFQHGLKTGLMVIVGSAVEITPKGEAKVTKTGPEPGPSMKVEELLPLIEKMTDKEALDQLAEMDSRATVLRAIDRQRKRLMPPDAGGTEKSDEETEEDLAEAAKVAGG